jgi:hypothetical protein
VHEARLAVKSGERGVADTGRRPHAGRRRDGAEHARERSCDGQAPWPQLTAVGKGPLLCSKEVM